MKNNTEKLYFLIVSLLFISILTIASSFAQIDIKDNSKFQVYKNNVLVSNHKTQANAIEKLIELKRKNFKDTIKIFTNGTITVKLGKTFFGKVTEVVKPFTPYTKDTILDGVIANRLNEKGVIHYGYLYKVNGFYEFIKVKAFDQKLTACETCLKLPLKQKIKVEFNYIDKNLIRYTELETLTALIEIKDRSFVKSNKRLRYGLNVANDCYYRVSNDSLKMGEYKLHSKEDYKASDGLYWHGKNYDYLDVGTWYIQKKFISKENENDFVESEIYTLEI